MLTISPFSLKAPEENRIPTNVNPGLVNRPPPPPTPEGPEAFQYIDFEVTRL